LISHNEELHPKKVQTPLEKKSQDKLQLKIFQTISSFIFRFVSISYSFQLLMNKSITEIFPFIKLLQISSFYFWHLQNFFRLFHLWTVIFIYLKKFLLQHFLCLMELVKIYGRIFGSCWMKKLQSVFPKFVLEKF